MGAEDGRRDYTKAKKASGTSTYSAEKDQTHPSQLLPIQITHHTVQLRYSLVTNCSLHQPGTSLETWREGVGEEEIVYWKLLGE